MAHKTIIPFLREKSAIQALQEKYEALRNKPGADEAELQGLRKQIENRQAALLRGEIVDPDDLFG